MSVWESTRDNRIKKRGGVYWARFRRSGHTVVKSLKTSSFEIAKRAVENIERDMALGLSWRADTETFDTAWAEFLIDKLQGVKTKKARPNTHRGYVGFGELYYLPFFKDMRLTKIDEDTINDFVGFVRTQRPDMHFDNVRKYLMGFFSWALRKGKIRVKPFFADPDIERKEEREEAGPGQAYTLEQLKVMRELALEQGSRFYLFILMMQYMGMRPSEVTQLSKDRVDFASRVIRLRKADTKTATARVIPIHPEVALRLEAQVSLSGSSPFVFPNKRDSQSPMDPTGFKNAWKAVKAHPEISGRVYDMRHTFITNAVAQGMNPAVVAMMTGTSLKMIEKRYLHFSPQDLNRALASFVL